MLERESNKALTSIQHCFIRVWMSFESFDGATDDDNYGVTFAGKLSECVGYTFFVDVDSACERSF